jgi:transcriptional regulator with XRE-family HTH domain
LRDARRAAGLSLDSAAVVAQIPKPSLQAYEEGSRVPKDRPRELLRQAFEIAPEWWDQAQQVEQPRQAEPSPRRPPPIRAEPLDDPTQLPLLEESTEPDGASESGLEVARASLARCRRAMVPGLSAEGLAKLIQLESSLAKTIASLSGELDRSEMEAFKRSREFTHFVELAVVALRPFPDASRALFRALGVSRGNSEESSAVVSAPMPPELPSLALAAERIDEWLEHSEQDDTIGYENTDRIVYPSAGWERKVAAGIPQSFHETRADLFDAIDDGGNWS